MKAGASAVRRVTRRLFEDSPELLLTHLVEDERLTEEEIRQPALLRAFFTRSHPLISVNMYLNM